MLWTHTLKQKCRHFDEIFITGCTGSCHFDNFQCSQWWTFHQNEDFSVSVHKPNHSGWTPFYSMYDPKCSTTFPWCTINAPAAFAWCTIHVPAVFAWCTNHFVYKVEFSYIGWNGVHPLCQWNLTLMAQFAIVTQDGQFLLGIVMSHECESLAFWHHFLPIVPVCTTWCKVDIH